MKLIFIVAAVIYFGNGEVISEDIQQIRIDFMEETSSNKYVVESTIERIQYCIEHFPLQNQPISTDNLSEKAILCGLQDHTESIAELNLPTIYKGVQVLYTNEEYYLEHYSFMESLNSTNITASNTSIVICNSDVKVCIGGASVGRMGPDCEFKSCPRLVPLLIIFFVSLTLLAVVVIPFYLLYRNQRKRAQGYVGLDFNSFPSNKLPIDEIEKEDKDLLDDDLPTKSSNSKDSDGLI